ncbi:MAG TPA: hypothetical protein VII06_05640 [Chloroflexota bacterium]
MSLAWSPGDLLGTLGMLLLLGAFLANAMGRLTATGALYHLLNGLGAALLAWYSVQLGVWVFAVLESVWALAALWNLVRALRRRAD